MERLYETHEVRDVKELGGLWDFVILDKPGEIRKVVIPSCWETYPGMENYRGRAVYSKKVKLEGNIRFCFKGISHTATVYLNEQEIATHYNAFTPFEVIVNNVKPGVYTLKIEVDNSFHEESALHIVNDYFSYGGINRPVFLEYIREAFIERVHFIPFRKNDIWYGKVQVRVNNLTDKDLPVRLEFEIDDKLHSTMEAFINPGIHFIEQEVEIKEALSYEPDQPKLYLWKTKLYLGEVLTDDLIERIGFREIKIKGKDIYFNEKVIHIKGFNRHEDHALFGCALPLEVMDNDLNLIIDMGANAVRTCHYPNDERFLDLCDEKGILVWEEGHARGLSEEQMRHKNFRTQSLTCIDEMIDNHYNHPSIFTWGILNECASHTEYGREIYIEQFQRIKQLDNSRPMTFASCHPNTDICMDLPDIVSMNLYPLWYHDSPVDEFLTKVYHWVQKTKGMGKPFLVSEIGAGAIYGYRASNHAKWSEERQAEILEKQLIGVLSRADMSGVFIWQFCDGRVPDECFYGRPRCMNNKGVVDEYRRKKLSYDTVKNIFKRY